MTSNIPPPNSVLNLFGNLPNGIAKKKDKGQIRLGVCVFFTLGYVECP
jgi:hypothetical protein